MLIFPEGTRRPVGAAPDYKSGIVPVYEALQRPVLPVALNSGSVLAAQLRAPLSRAPSSSRCCRPIPPGLPRDEFRLRLQNTIETATARLVAEARQRNSGLG